MRLESTVIPLDALPSSRYPQTAVELDAARDDGCIANQGKGAGMAWSWKRTAIIGGTVLVGGAACFVTGGAAAPAIGSWIGSTFMGLSGAAATSAGLAALGGGSLAAGGAGMAGGITLVTNVITAVGVGAAGAATKNLTDDLVEGKRCRSCQCLIELNDSYCSNCGQHV